MIQAEISSTDRRLNCIFKKERTGKAWRVALLEVFCKRIGSGAASHPMYGTALTEVAKLLLNKK
jgi:hypothetical protein